jgi:hypothetical protein
MKKPIHHKMQKKIIPLVSISLICITCSSVEIIKNYGEKGHLKEIRVLEKNNLKYNIIFEYNKKGMVKKISKFMPPSEKPFVTRRFKYNRLGKLRLQYYQGIKTENDKTFNDIWVESFFYNRTNNLIRIETALKSSYSIAKHKTPFKTTRYYYSYQNLDKIRINGVTFSKEILLTYEKNSLSKIQYKLFLLNRKNRRFELKKNLQFFYKKNTPMRLEDLISKSEITSVEKIKGILRDEEVDIPMKKLKYSSDLKFLIDDMGKNLSSLQGDL